MFDAITLGELQARTSEKWAAYPREILPAFIAETDFRLAPAVRDALQAAIDRSDLGYARPSGLNSAFASFAKARFDWAVDENSVFAFPDTMAAAVQTMLMATEPGDSIVINPPVYPPFFEIIRTSNRHVVEVPLQVDAHGRWTLDPARTEAAFAGGARAYLLCSPHNPVGRSWSMTELREIVRLASRHDVLVISDEIHAPLTMPTVEHVPLAGVDPSFSNYVVLFSASKAWNIAGLKCGLLVAGSQRLRDAFRARLAAIPTEIQWRIGHLGVIGTIAALRDGGEWLDDLRAQLARNAARLDALLRRHLPGAVYRAPEAGFLAWIECSQLGLGPDPAAHFLARGRVALQSGLDFGAPGAYHVRLNIGTSSALLDEIVGRMAISLG